MLGTLQRISMIKNCKDSKTIKQLHIDMWFYSSKKVDTDAREKTTSDPCLIHASESSPIAKIYSIVDEYKDSSNRGSIQKSCNKTNADFFRNIDVISSTYIDNLDSRLSSQERYKLGQADVHHPEDHVLH